MWQAVPALPMIAGPDTWFAARSMLTVLSSAYAMCAQPDGSIALTGSLSLLMTDFGVEPPTAMLGMMKTADQVTVKFELRVRAADAVN